MVADCLASDCAAMLFSLSFFSLSLAHHAFCNHALWIRDPLHRWMTVLTPVFLILFPSSIYTLFGVHITAAFLISIQHRSFTLSCFFTYT